MGIFYREKVSRGEKFRKTDFVLSEKNIPLTPLFLYHFYWTFDVLIMLIVKSSRVIPIAHSIFSEDFQKGRAKIRYLHLFREVIKFQ